MLEEELKELVRGYVEANDVRNPEVQDFLFEDIIDALDSVTEEFQGSLAQFITDTAEEQIRDKGEFWGNRVQYMR